MRSSVSTIFLNASKRQNERDTEYSVCSSNKIHAKSQSCANNLASSTKGSMSRRERFWKTFKRHTLLSWKLPGRSRERLNAGGRPKGDYDDDDAGLNKASTSRLCYSYPNLSNQDFNDIQADVAVPIADIPKQKHSSLEKMFRRKPKKGIIRGDTESTLAAASTDKRLSTSHRTVEFLGKDEVFAVTAANSPNSPSRDDVQVHANGATHKQKGRVSRQVTAESMTSTDSVGAHSNQLYNNSAGTFFSDLAGKIRERLPSGPSFNRQSSSVEHPRTSAPVESEDVLPDGPLHNDNDLGSGELFTEGKKALSDRAKKPGDSSETVENTWSRLVISGQQVESGDVSDSDMRSLRRSLHRGHDSRHSHDDSSETVPEDPPVEVVVAEEEKETEGVNVIEGTPDKDSVSESSEFVSYLLEVQLHEGRDLVIRDASGTSDPYVKFKYRSKVLCRSTTVLKNLNPTWDEKFNVVVDDLTVPLVVEVYDYDRFALDDFMGAASVSLQTMDPRVPLQCQLQLSENHGGATPSPDQGAYMGFLNVTLVLTPQTREEKETLPAPAEPTVQMTAKAASVLLGEDEFRPRNASFHPSAWLLKSVETDSSEREHSSTLSTLTNEAMNFLKKSVRSNSGDASSANKKSQKGGGQQGWSSIVNIVLVESRNLLPTDYHTNAPLPDPFVKFKLGPEKYKSKVVSKTLEPRWHEQFDFHVYDEHNQVLEIMVSDKSRNVFMGRCTIDLQTLKRESSVNEWYDLEDGAGQVHCLITVTGMLGSETVSDLASFVPSDRQEVERSFSIPKSFTNMRDVGRLTVKVFKSQGLASADLGGKSDPFCICELVNARLQTDTKYKTLNPEWNKIFTFNVKDIHSILEVTVYDEDPNKKFEFLGKVAIPLLKIRNGEKRWYAFKDRKLRRRAKGQILLELDVIFNSVRASVRTFNPREEKYVSQEQKFKRQVFMRNVMRIKTFAMAGVETGEFVASCWSWDSPMRSMISFIVYMVVVYFAEIYMLPLALLMLFFKSYVFKLMVQGITKAPEQEESYFDSEDDDEAVDDKADGSSASKAEERKSLKERLQAMQDILLTIQNALDYVASLIERVKNTFNFTQPFLSWLLIIVLFIGTIVLYLVPVRWLIMAWGINKFTKKLRNPNAIPNNELLDFLSRVPSDNEIRLYGEFRPEPVDSIAAAHLSVRRKRPS